ncbi:MAG: HD domain-containing protein [Candidatus Hodarchaeota archaeon]
MMSEDWGFIKDAIYGYLIISKNQKEIIDTYPMQRLRRIRQLAGSEYVYMGATHCRFSHSLGVSHLAEQLIINLSRNVEISRSQIEKIKIAAMLHDIGHGPFSHVSESLLINYLEKTHEDMTTWIIQKSELKEKLEKMGYDSDEISKLAVGKLRKKGEFFMDQIISSSVDVDALDYIVRDSRFSGAEYGFVDIFRLIYSMDIVSPNGDLAIDLTALSALEAFLLARFESFKSIYFHKTSRAVQIMIADALDRAKEELDFLNIKTPDDYLKWDDYTTWTMLKNSQASSDIIDNLCRRILLKVAYEQTSHVKEEIFPTIVTKDKVRLQIEKEIAEKAKVDPEKVWIDVPNLPSVPYRHSIHFEPMEIPVFQKTRDGKKITKRITEISNVIRVLKGFLNIVRVYTYDDKREIVAKAAEKVFGIPSSAKISM